MGKEGKYIYGVIETWEEKNFGPIGEGEGKIEVYTILFQDIACVVSDSSMNPFNSMVKEEIAHHLVDHQTVIEKVMKEYTIIPMKFGTVVANGDEVRQVLKRGYPQFKELFINMDGKIELDVACTWSDLNSIIKEIGDQDRSIREFKAEIAKRPPTEALQDRIKIGMMIKDAMDKRREKEQAHIIDFLKGVTVDFQKHQVMDDKMILNCAFLLEKSKEPDFDAHLKELDKEYKQKVNFRCVGPLPPYSFATCQLKKVGFSQIDEARKSLALSKNTSLEEIKESYHKLAQRNHPDKDPNNTQLKEEFEKVTHAYKLLTSCYQGEGISFEDKKREDFIMVEIIRP